MSTENELIEYWANNLAERVIEIRFIDMNEMKSAISVHIKSALFDCLKMQVSETRKKLDEHKKQIQLGGSPNKHVHANIISLKQKLKEENQTLAWADRENQARELVLYLREHNEQLLINFYKHYDTVRGFEIKPRTYAANKK